MKPLTGRDPRGRLTFRITRGPHRLSLHYQTRAESRDVPLDRAPHEK